MKFINKIVVCLLVFCFFTVSAQAARIKELAQLAGVRANQLIGYGLVVGLNGTGDSSITKFTNQSLANMLEQLGMIVDRNRVKVDNVAAVIVTAELPPFARTGSRIDVTVSSIGDAEDLSGGALLMTPLKGPDGQVYAVSQGPLVVGGLAFGGKAAKVQKNHPTAGRIPGGALVEREVVFDFADQKKLDYRLKSFDFTTVSRMTAVVNKHFGTQIASALDGGSMRVVLPSSYQNQMVQFVAELEKLDVIPDSVARIVVNEKTGTIVMGEKVRISTVAVSHGNLNLVIGESAEVSQPEPLSEGQTVVIPQTTANLSEDKGNLVVLEMGVSIGDVASALNAIGATPRDLIAIFQAIMASGALHADLVVL